MGFLQLHPKPVFPRAAIAVKSMSHRAWINVCAKTFFQRHRVTGPHKTSGSSPHTGGVDNRHIYIYVHSRQSCADETRLSGIKDRVVLCISWTCCTLSKSLSCSWRAGLQYLVITKSKCDYCDYEVKCDYCDFNLKWYCKSSLWCNQDIFFPPMMHVLQLDWRLLAKQVNMRTVTCSFECLLSPERGK